MFIRKATRIALLIIGLIAISCAQTTKLTPEQIAEIHGKLFHAGMAGQLQERLAHTKGDVTLMPEGRSSEIGIDLPLAWQLQHLACESDLVIIAKAGTGTSHPTFDQGFIYTDWQFSVRQIVKDNLKAPLHVDDVVIVTRPGGTLEIDGRKISAKLNDFRDFVPGETLLLYLKFVPATGAYAMARSNYFPVSDSNVKMASDGVTHCGGAR